MFKELNKIRGMFPGKAYLGGSKMLEIEFDTPMNSDDVDVFIYMPKPMETWALDNFIRACGFNIIKHGVNYDGHYKIAGQYKFYKVCPREEVTFGRAIQSPIEIDLIFIDPDKVDCWEETYGSSLAAVQRKLVTGFSPKGSLGDLPTKYHAQELKSLKEGTCFLFTGNTDTQEAKVRERCKLLGLKIV